MNHKLKNNLVQVALPNTAAAGLTAEVINHVMTRRLDDYSAQARRLARDGILDFLAVAVAGANDPTALQIAQTCKSGGKLRASFLGLDLGGEWKAAAAVNGFVSHVLDFDDMGQSILGHPSAPVLSALVPLAEARHAAGRDVLLAYMSAVEGISFVGRVLAARIQDAGFHTTAVLGALGAALACSRLLGSDRRQFEWAASLALAQGAGLIANFGTPAKPMQVGFASAAGARAAELAHHGVQGSVQAIEAICGMLGADPTPPHDAASEWEDGRIRFKRYPSCSLTHQAIEAGTRLKQRLGTSEAERIVVHGSYRIPVMLRYPVPVDCYQAKFSLPYCLATALVCPEPLLGHLSSGFLDDRMLHLARRVEFRIHADLADASAINDEFTQVDVRIGSGQTMSETVRGRVAISSRSELLAKAAWCLESRGLGSRLDRLVSLVDGVEGLRNAGDLVALVTEGSGPTTTAAERGKSWQKSGRLPMP